MTFKLDFEVRDNEVDIQGIVNNANYFIYLAHARHKWADDVGINFAEWAKKKQSLVILSSLANYKESLRPNDKFYVTCEPKQINSNIKFDLYQEIRLCNSDKLILTATFTATCINGNAISRKDKLYIPKEIKDLSVIEETNAT